MQAQDRPHFTEEGKHLGKPGHSLALRYEMLLKELSHLPGGKNTGGHAGEGGSPTKRSTITHTRINTCFQILDEVLPSLGVYQRVMRLLKDELYAAVYSQELTSIKGGAGRGKDSSAPQPLPYFVLAQKLMSKRASDMSKLKAEIETLKEQLYTCEADLEKASNTIESCRHDIKERDAKIHRLSSELRLCFTENERLQKLDGQHQRAQERLRQEAEFRMLSFRNTIGSLKEDKARLKVYKDTYDKLHDVFSNPGSAQQENKATTKANSRTELEEQLGMADLLRRQLLGMQNTLIAEYDVWMNQLTVGEKQAAQILPASVILNKQNFRHSIAEITTELALLTDHSECLEKRQAELKAQSEASSRHPLVVSAHPDNPLVPQQQLTSKYAIMIHSSSDGGSSFYSLKEVQSCDSCGQQTVVCPHKAVRGDMLVQLPVNSTHLKISRPALTVTQPLTKHSAPVKDSHTRAPISISDEPEHTMSPDFEKLWMLFRAKFPHYLSTVPRLLTADEVLSLVQQFYAVLLNQDDHAVLGEDQDTRNLLESLFQFLGERYHIQDIAPQICFDFLTSLIKHQPQNIELSVLSYVLCGQVDASTFRYLLLLAGYVDLLPCTSIKELTPLLTTVYSFLQEEDIEHLVMNFIAHGNNKISKQLVMDYLVWLVLRHREPLVLLLEAKLTEQPSIKPNGMQEAEFADAMESLVPTVSDLLCRHLFLQSLAQYQADNNTKREHLPVKRLCYIAAYLQSVCQAKSVLSKVEELAMTITTATGQSTTPELTMTMKSVRVVAERVKALSLCS